MEKFTTISGYEYTEKGATLEQVHKNDRPAIFFTIFTVTDKTPAGYFDDEVDIYAENIEIAKEIFADYAKRNFIKNTRIGHITIH